MQQMEREQEKEQNKMRAEVARVHEHQVLREGMHDNSKNKGKRKKKEELCVALKLHQCLLELLKKPTLFI